MIGDETAQSCPSVAAHFAYRVAIEGLGVRELGPQQVTAMSRWSALRDLVA